MIILIADQTTWMLLKHKTQDDDDHNRKYFVLRVDGDLQQLKGSIYEYQAHRLVQVGEGITYENSLLTDRSFQEVLRQAKPFIVGANFRRWREWLEEWLHRVI